MCYSHKHISNKNYLIYNNYENYPSKKISQFGQEIDLYFLCYLYDTMLYVAYLSIELPLINKYKQSKVTNDVHKQGKLQIFHPNIWTWLTSSFALFLWYQSDCFGSTINNISTHLKNTVKHILNRCVYILFSHTNRKVIDTK